MAKLGEFKTPTGASGNLFDIGSWASLILGTVVLFITFGLGQKMAQGINGRAPFLDTNIEQPWKSSPVTLINQSQQKSRTVL